jgi:PsbP-like protein
MTKLLAFFFLLSIVACGQTNTKQSDEKNKPSKSMSGWKTLNQSNYSIQYPPTWEADPSGQMGTSFFLFSPLESDKDKFKENVNLLIQDLAGQHIDLNKYTEISEGQIKSMVTNSSLIESKRIKNNGEEYQKLIYSGDQGEFHLQFEQFYWVIKDKAYVLTFTSEKDKFANFKETGEGILNSFSFKK